MFDRAPAFAGGRADSDLFGESAMKTQMKFQKILSLATLIIAALTFVYCLCFFSGSLGDIYWNLEPVIIPTLTGDITFDIHAQNFYDTAQAFNDALFFLSIAFIVGAVLLYVTACNKRRNYYVSNYVSIIAVAIYAAVFALYALIMVSKCLDLFVNDIDWATYLEKYNYNYVEGTQRRFPYYSDDKSIFVIGYILFIVVIVDAVALALNLIWKIKLMRGEKQLLEQGFVKEVA